MTQYSFTFGGINMLDEYGVWVTAYDVLLPGLNNRQVNIPGRNGSYDFGKNKYKNRILRLNCDTRTGKTRAEMREIAYILSQKSQIVMWDEPDKYYVGRIYDPQELTNLGSVVYKFNLSFVCDPFANGEQKEVTFQNFWQSDYAGTAETPTILKITNNGDQTINGIKITITEKRSNV